MAFADSSFSGPKIRDTKTAQIRANVSNSNDEMHNTINNMKANRFQFKKETFLSPFPHERGGTRFPYLYP